MISAVSFPGVITPVTENKELAPETTEALLESHSATPDTPYGNCFYFLERLTKMLYRKLIGALATNSTQESATQEEIKR